jgi:hypothetical protein
MDYVVVVQIFDGLKGLGEEFEGLRLCEYIFGVLMEEQISNFCVFHDHINVLVVTKGIPNLNNMGVVHF